MLRIMVLVMLYTLGMIAALPHVIAISRLPSTCTNTVRSSVLIEISHFRLIKDVVLSMLVKAFASYYII